MFSSYINFLLMSHNPTTYIREYLGHRPSYMRMHYMCMALNKLALFYSGDTDELV